MSCNINGISGGSEVSGWNPRRRRTKERPYVYEESDIARFWTKVDIAAPDACWLWTGALGGGSKANHQYGRFKLSKYITLSAHRAAWEIANGDRLGKRFACHHCDNTQCANPAHIYAGNHASNVNDAKVRNRFIGRGSRSLGSENPQTDRQKELSH